MPGLAMPHKIINGKLQLEDGAQQLAKVIMIAVGPRNNTNPWNEAGIDAAPFRLNDVATRALIRNGIERHFTRLERAGRAVLESMEFVQEEAVLSVELRYKDLVRNKKATATLPVLQAFGGGV